MPRSELDVSISGSVAIPGVYRLVYGSPWAILPETLAMICEVVDMRAAGQRFTAEEIEQRVGAASRPRTRTTAASIAVLPVFGIISYRMNMMTAMSGGTSTELLAAEFRQLVNDDSIGAIVLDVDSPGGMVDGVPELAAEIFNARGSKPIVAVANSLAASAAYWIATAADEVIVTPSGQVGSIGVITAHQDESGYYEQQGVKTTLISAGRYKAEGNPYEPLTDDARASIQARVDDYYGMFVNAVARHRGVKATDVRNGFGEGRVVGAQEAKKLGMVDRVETLNETLSRLAGNKAPARRSAAAVVADLQERQREQAACNNGAGIIVEDRSAAAIQHAVTMAGLELGKQLRHELVGVE